MVAIYLCLEVSFSSFKFKIQSWYCENVGDFHHFTFRFGQYRRPRTTCVIDKLVRDETNDKFEK